MQMAANAKQIWGYQNSRELARPLWGRRYSLNLNNCQIVEEPEIRKKYERNTKRNVKNELEKDSLSQFSSEF